MNRKLSVLFAMTLLAGMMLLAGNSAVRASDGYTDWTYVYEVEPNDTPAQAVPVAYNSRLSGDVTLSDPWDYFSFVGTAGDNIVLTFAQSWHDPELLILLDPSLNPIPLTGEVHFTALPASGVYTIGVSRQPLDEYFGSYSIYLVKLVGDEPNDTLATATPVESLQTVEAIYDYPCDVDYYVFQGRKGDVFPISYLQNGLEGWPQGDYVLYDANGNELEWVNVLPADGTYYLLAYGWVNADDEQYCVEGPYSVTMGYPLWVSAAQNNLGGNKAIKAQDIAMRGDAPGTWQLVFDASDVRITKNINAIERLNDGSILMSLVGPQTVDGVGKVMPQDIIRFYPTSLGDTTAGHFEMYLDGSDVGLTAAGENIDAIHFKPYEGDPNPLVISVTGNGSVSKYNGGTLSFQDEDLINFVGTSYGAESAGAWRLDLDGSTVPGLAAEDISASTWISLSPTRTSRLLLAFNNGFNIGGTRGGPRDVVDLDLDDRQPAEPYHLSTLAAKNLTNKTIDAMTIGVALTP